MKILFFLLIFISQTAFATDIATRGATPSASPSPAAQNPIPTEKLALRLMGDPETFDWNIAHTMVETYVLMNLMDGLVSLDPDLKPLPALAESWKISKDGKTYTFKLRAGVKWSDGVLLKAKDFVTSWKRLLTKTTAAAYAYFLFDIVGAEDFYRGKLTDFSRVGVKAKGDSILEVRLVKPVSYWIYIPSFWVTFPIRQDLLDKYGKAWSRPGNMQTVGPFNLEKYEVDHRVMMKSNPYYYGERGNVAEVEALIIREDGAAFHLYESGKLDFLNDISTITLSKIHDRPDLKLFPYLKSVYIAFVISKTGGSDPYLRRAISMSIDKRRIGDFLHGGQKAATTFVPPPLLGYSDAIGFRFDPVQAKKELALAKFESGHPPKLDMILPNNEKSSTIAQYVQQEIKKNLGLDIEIVQYDNKTYFKQLDQKTSAIYYASWGADYPDPDNFLSVFFGDSGNNRTGWKNKTYDDQVKEARYESDPVKREPALRAAQRLLLETDAVVVPLYYEPNSILIKPRVQGLELNPMNLLNLRKVKIVR